MDKYEFNIKVEQIKKLTSKGDYETAMKIADTIDWRRVRNANLLSMVAQVYEKNEEYQEAKDILLLAFERAPIGKRLLFKLTELALKEGHLDEAEAYYREFCDLAPDDSRQHLLRYMILAQKQAPLEQLIHSLEGYTAEELDEKWLYELASLYHLAGDGDQCVKACDKIMLMFGLGKYVDKAMELKLHYAPLTKYQMDLVENRDKYEEKLRVIEQSFGEGMDDDESYDDEPDLDVEPAEEPVPVWVPEPVAIVEEEPMIEPTEEPEVSDKHDFVMAVKEAEVEEHLAEEMSKISFEDYADEDLPAERTRILGDLKSIKLSTTVQEPLAPTKEGVQEPEKLAAGEAAKVKREPAVEAKAEIKTEIKRKPDSYFMIQARTPEKGLEMAVETLKELQNETGIKNPVAKISGSKLNHKGLLASVEKLSGKDLIIEEAGDLSPETVNELEELLTAENSSMRIILVDNPKQIKMILNHHPSLAQWFQSAGRQEEVNAPADKMSAEAAAPAESPVVQDNRPVRQVKPVREEYQKPIQKPVQKPMEEPEYDDEEMDIDEFAQYACKYAGEIDCSITGKSMLALYERIEIMEEDGIPLTQTSAEELIEEAADKAERPSLGKLITGVFSSKYDKDGLLILKEEHFI